MSIKIIFMDEHQGCLHAKFHLLLKLGFWSVLNENDHVTCTVRGVVCHAGGRLVHGWVHGHIASEMENFRMLVEGLVRTWELAQSQSPSKEAIQSIKKQEIAEIHVLFSLGLQCPLTIWMGLVWIYTSKSLNSNVSFQKSWPRIWLRAAHLRRLKGSCSNLTGREKQEENSGTVQPKPSFLVF